jgi:translation initiation factor 2A
MYYLFHREPQWSSDEKLCARNANNEVLFYNVPNFDTVAQKIHIQKVADFSIAPGTSPYHILCYVPGEKSLYWTM